jgi:hypothetical protein
MFDDSFNISKNLPFILFSRYVISLNLNWRKGGHFFKTQLGDYS